MKLFSVKEIREAKHHALEGGQALHVWKPGDGWVKEAPQCFRTHRELWGHLFDQDRERLEKTARKLGVRRVSVGSPGTGGQHVDLCGKPLREAIRMCDETPDCWGVKVPMKRECEDCKGHQTCELVTR